MRATFFSAVLLVLSQPFPLPAAALDDELLAFLNVVAISGREEPAAQFILGHLADLSASRDALGNVVFTVGSGEPRRLMACALGEPGFVVSGIQADGYVRVVPAGGGPVGALWTQSHEGNTVVIGGSQGWRPGGVALPSVHLQQGVRQPRERPFSVEDLYIDVGAESAAEVAEMGIRLMDPVALIRRPTRMAGDLVAAPFAAVKGSCLALADAARRFRPAPGTGTVVFAWTVLDGINRAGLLHVVREKGPFSEAVLLGPGFGWEAQEGDRPVFKPIPNPGAGPIGAGRLPATMAAVTQAPHLEPGSGTAGAVEWGTAQVGYLGLPALYPGTPVETISLRDVKSLAGALLMALDISNTRSGDLMDPDDGIGRDFLFFYNLLQEPIPFGQRPVPHLKHSTNSIGDGPGNGATSDLPTSPQITEPGQGHKESAKLLGSLIARYGVSGAETPVREEILRNLPAGAKPEVDDKGDVVVTLGSGGEPLLFVAHLDEVGFRVEEVLPDGRLRLQNRGGLVPSVWEAQAALVHGDRGPVPAVFEPREDWWTADKAARTSPLTVYLGVSSAQQAEDLGVRAGATVTMPKRMFRIGRHRVLARSFDDRVGSTALLLALRQLDPAKLRRRVIFAWSVGEEVGLDGARALAERLRDVREVHAVDTFVSSDSPLESHRFAGALLGQGAVLRAMDNGYYAPRELVDRFLALARRHDIPLQVGFTGGATDGMPFLASGAAMLPFSWPGRYSHSPVEVADLRDLEALVRLIVAVATGGTPTP